MAGYLVSLFMGLVVGAAWRSSVSALRAADDRPGRPVRNGEKRQAVDMAKRRSCHRQTSIERSLGMIHLYDRLEKACTISSPRECRLNCK
jgi:hypothetical protein